MNKCLIFLLLLTGMGHLPVFGQNYNYAPNSLHFPVLQKRGDLSMGIGWGHATNSFDAQAAYSPARHWLVMGNYFNARRRDVRQQTKLGTDFHMGEVAVGLYETYNKGVGSITAGWGAGRIFNNYELNNSAIFHLQRWFVQPGYAYRSDYFQAAVAIRLSRLNYAKGKISYSINANDLEHIQNIEQKNPILLPEIGIQAGIIFKPVYLGLSVATIFPDTNLWDFSRLNATLMLSTTFGTRHKG